MTKRQILNRRSSRTGRMLLAGTLFVFAPEWVFAQSAPDQRVDELLTKLQDRGDRLKDIRCSIKLKEDDRVNLTQRTKTGRIQLLFAEPNPTFFIEFDKTESDGVSGKREWYLFDGRWLHEGSERLKQVTRSEIAAPGQKVNLFDLENAPFPMPFGQKKETILRNFDVQLIPPAPGDPAYTDHLLCTPKAESRFHRKYDRLDFYVRQQLWLPIRIATTTNKGLESLVADFPDLNENSINSGVKKKDFEPPDEWKKYKIVVEGSVPVEHVPRP